MDVIPDRFSGSAFTAGDPDDYLLTHPKRGGGSNSRWSVQGKGDSTGVPLGTCVCSGVFPELSQQHWMLLVMREVEIKQQQYQAGVPAAVWE